MRKALSYSIVAAAVLILTGAAMAQNPDWYQHRDERYRGEHWRGRVFSEIREDLDHVQANAFSGRDQYRITRTKEELNELQGSLQSGRYNEEEVNDVTRSLQRVVADNRLSDRDRHILNDDLQRLRDYREHHEHWGEREERH